MPTTISGTSGIDRIQAGALAEESPNNTVGYTVGAGGTVTQTTSKATPVTLNRPTGLITTTSDSIASGAIASFTFSNSVISNVDNVLVTLAGGASNASNYIVGVTNISNGSCTIYIINRSAGALAESLNIRYTVFQGASS